MTLQRRTLSGAARVEGVGLFTGRDVSLELAPAEAGTGVRLERVDLEGRPGGRALITSLSAEPVHPVFASIPPRSTNVRLEGGGNACVYTVEHVLSALAGLGITDVLVRLDGAEVPIDDGSADCFVRAIMGVGTRELSGGVEAVSLREPMIVEDGVGGSITVEPWDGCEYHYALDYGPGPIRPQSASWEGGASAYVEEVGPARTFSLEREAMAMKGAGLFGRFSARDLLVIGEHGPIENAYRFENEPSRHKLLDLIGDLALVGRPIRGKISAVRSGHALNHELASLLFALANAGETERD